MTNNKENLKHSYDSDMKKVKKMGRPAGTNRIPKMKIAQNIPFTEFEDQLLCELIKYRGQNKRYWVKKFAMEGIEAELKKIEVLKSGLSQ